MSNFSILVPCFNSEKFIKKNIEILINKIKELKVRYELIIVNDGSTDGTLKELIKIKSRSLKIINLKKNQGKSSAIKKAIKLAKLQNIILIDCDLPYFSKFEFLIKKLKENYDFVTIDRRNKKSKILNKKTDFYAFFRLLIGNIIGYFVNILLNLKNGHIDTQAGLKGFKNIKELKKTNFISKKFFLDLEIIFLFKKINKVFYYIPVRYIVNKSSTINFFSINSLRILMELFTVIFYLKKK